MTEKCATCEEAPPHLVLVLHSKMKNGIQPLFYQKPHLTQSKPTTTRAKHWKVFKLANNFKFLAIVLLLLCVTNKFVANN